MTEVPEMETPTPGVSIEEYVDTMIRDGVVAVPCPHGMGVYYVHLTEACGYGTPRLTFAAEDKQGKYGLKAAPAHLRSNKGRDILWYPRGLGFITYGSSKYARDDPKMMLALGKMLIGIIVSGRRLYAMYCGQNVNSWNTDETMELDYQ